MAISLNYIRFGMWTLQWCQLALYIKNCFPWTEQQRSNSSGGGIVIVPGPGHKGLLKPHCFHHMLDRGWLQWRKTSEDKWPFPRHNLANENIGKMTRSHQASASPVWPQEGVSKYQRQGRDRPGGGGRWRSLWPKGMLGALSFQSHLGSSSVRSCTTHHLDPNTQNFFWTIINTNQVNFV